MGLSAQDITAEPGDDAGSFVAGGGDPAIIPTIQSEFGTPNIAPSNQTVTVNNARMMFDQTGVTVAEDTQAAAMDADITGGITGDITGGITGDFGRDFGGDFGAADENLGALWNTNTGSVEFFNLDIPDQSARYNDLIEAGTHLAESHAGFGNQLTTAGEFAVEMRGGTIEKADEIERGQGDKGKWFYNTQTDTWHQYAGTDTFNLAGGIYLPEGHQDAPERDITTPVITQGTAGGGLQIFPDGEGGWTNAAGEAVNADGTLIEVATSGGNLHQVDGEWFNEAGEPVNLDGTPREVGFADAMDGVGAFDTSLEDPYLGERGNVPFNWAGYYDPNYPPGEKPETVPARPVFFDQPYTGVSGGFETFDTQLGGAQPSPEDAVRYNQLWDDDFLVEDAPIGFHPMPRLTGDDIATPIGFHPMPPEPEWVDPFGFETIGPAETPRVYPSVNIDPGYPVGDINQAVPRPGAQPSTTQPWERTKGRVEQAYDPTGYTYEPDVASSGIYPGDPLFVEDFISADRSAAEMDVLGATLPEPERIDFEDFDPYYGAEGGFQRIVPEIAEKMYSPYEYEESAPITPIYDEPVQYYDEFAFGGFSQGGHALVGEMGPDLVDLPPGAQVMPAGITEMLTGRPTRRPRSLMRPAGMRVPSAQTIGNLLPEETEMYQEMGRLAGIPEKAFEREFRSMVPMGRGGTNQARFTPRRTGRTRYGSI